MVWAATLLERWLAEWGEGVVSLLLSLAARRTPMAHSVHLTADILKRLDLTPAQVVIDPLVEAGDILNTDVKLTFDIHFPRDPADPRELSEIPEVRLWFIYLDTRYPWLPFVLDWEGGELGRYTAMLVPHQFSPTEGIRYNPEALEIFVMGKIFVIATWLQTQGVTQYTRLRFMTQVLGYDIDEGLFELLTAR